jgi:uncharacterized protein (TIGR00369 family)
MIKGHNVKNLENDNAAITLQQWLEEERRVRQQWGKPGSSSPEIIAKYSGMEFLQAMMAGQIDYPPIADTLNFSLIHAEPGRVIFQGTPLFAHYNPIGSVHGGWFCTLLDSALGCAVQSTLQRGFGYTTLELKVNLIRALTDKTGPVRAEGTIVHGGRQTGIAEARLYDSKGKIYASASTTCLIFPIAGDKPT